MRKLSVGVILLLILVVYANLGKPDEAEPLARNTATSPISSNSSTSQTGTYKDGTYTGSVADAFYGPLQVQATIQNGKIIDVQFPQYPNDRGESIQINSQAMPLLKQEAIVAQNANVDIITGATQTSQAFVQTLDSALAQAR